MQSTNYTEQEIISRILQGEKALFEIIVRRFNASLYKVGRSYNYNLEDTKDLMQETFIDAYKGLDKFEHRSGFKTWLIRIMLNNCYKKKNRASFINENGSLENDNGQSMFKEEGNDTDKLIQRRELGHIIEASLMKIPYDYRMTFSLREINGCSVIETANLLQISESNVKVRLNRAKAMLRREISKVYSANELFEFNLVHCDEIVDLVMNYVND